MLDSLLNCGNMLVGLYEHVPFLIDFLLFLTFFLGLTKAFFRDEYAVQARLGITLFMTFLFLFFEIKTGQTLKDLIGPWILVAVLLAAAAFYFLVYLTDMGVLGTLAICYSYAYIFASITVPELIKGIALYLNLIFIFAIVFAAVGFIVFIWKIFNITEKDEIITKEQASSSDFLKDAPDKAEEPQVETDVKAEPRQTVNEPVQAAEAKNPPKKRKVNKR